MKDQLDKALVISPLYGVPDTVLARPSVPGQDIVFLLGDSFCVGGVKPQPLWVLDSDKDVCCHHFSSWSIWIG